MSTNVRLTPDLERFARQCVTEGRYNNVSEVVRSALRLLQDVEGQRAAFTATLDAAMAEADRDGTFGIDELVTEMRSIIDARTR